MADLAISPRSVAVGSKPARVFARLRRLFAYPALLSTFVVNAGLVIAIWVRHGNPGDLSSASAKLIAAGQISAVAASYLAIVGLLLAARVAPIEQILGDRAARYRRLVGFSAVLLIGICIASTVGGFALLHGVPFLDELGTRI
jgi:hypothetical protein